MSATNAPDGTVIVIRETTNHDGSATKTTETTRPDGSRLIVRQTTAPDGAVVVETTEYPPVAASGAAMGGDTQISSHEADDDAASDYSRGACNVESVPAYGPVYHSAGQEEVGACDVDSLPGYHDPTAEPVEVPVPEPFTSRLEACDVGSLPGYHPTVIPNVIPRKAVGRGTKALRERFRGVFKTGRRGSGAAEQTTSRDRVGSADDGGSDVVEGLPYAGEAPGEDDGNGGVGGDFMTASVRLAPTGGDEDEDEDVPLATVIQEISRRQGGTSALSEQESARLAALVRQSSGRSGMGGDGRVEDGGRAIPLAQAMKVLASRGVRAVPERRLNSIARAHGGGTPAEDAKTTPLHALCAAPTRGESDPAWWEALHRLVNLEKPEAKSIVEDNRGRFLRTPLHVACCRRPPPSVVRALLGVSAAPAGRADAFGFRPVHLACLHGASDAVLRILLGATAASPSPPPAADAGGDGDDSAVGSCPRPTPPPPGPTLRGARFAPKDDAAPPPTSGYDGGGDTGLSELHRLCDAPMGGREDARWDAVIAHLDRVGPRSGKSQAERRGGPLRRTPLHVACARRPPPRALERLLRASDVPARWADGGGSLPLHLLCRGGDGDDDGDAIRALVDAHPAAREARDADRLTPIDVRLEARGRPPSPAVVEALAPPPAPGSGAASLGDPSRLQSLCLEAGERREDSAAWEAVLDFLRDRGGDEAKASAEETWGNARRTALHLVCCLNPPPAVVAALLEASPDVAETADSLGFLPLHLACLHGADGDVLRLLVLANPRSIYAQDWRGCTPIQIEFEKEKVPPPSVAQLLSGDTPPALGKLSGADKGRPSEGRCDSGGGDNSSTGEEKRPGAYHVSMAGGDGKRGRQESKSVKAIKVQDAPPYAVLPINGTGKAGGRGPTVAVVPGSKPVVPGAAGPDAVAAVPGAGAYIGAATGQYFFNAGPVLPRNIGPSGDDDANLIPPRRMAGAETRENIPPRTELEEDEAADAGDTSGLRNLCRRPRGGPDDSGWDSLRDFLASFDDATQKKHAVEMVESQYFATPLHLVCCRDPPADVVRSLLEASSEPSRWPDTSGLLPIHAACLYRASAEVIQLLVDAHPESKTKTDDSGRSPLHWTCRNTKDRPPNPEVLGLVIEGSMVNKIDSNGHTPIKSFASQAKKVRAHQTYEKQRAKECAKIFLDIEPKGTPEFLKALHSLPSYLHDDTVVHPHTKRVLNGMISQRFPTAILFIDFYVHILLIVSFTFTVHDFIDATYQGGSEKQRTNGMSGWCIGFMYAGVAYLILRETTQACSLAAAKAFKAWFWDPWNWLDVAHICLVLSATTLMHTGAGDKASVRVLLIATGGILWIKLAAFLKTTMLEFAVFVSGVIRVAWILVPFLVTVGLVLGAFAQMYYIDATSSSTCTENQFESDTELTFCDMSESLLKTYAMFVAGGVEEAAFTTSTTTAWLTAAFAFLMVLLLLTVLIAIVTDSYSKVKDQSEVVFWWHRFNFAFEIDAIMNFLGKKLKTRNLSMSPQDGNDKGRILFDIIRLEFEPPNDYAVWDARKTVQRNWTGPTWFFTDADNRMPSWIKRALLAVFVPIWLLAGLISMGWFWPPQIREFLLCPSVPDSPTDNGDDLMNQRGSHSLPEQNEAETNLSSLLKNVQDLKKIMKTALREMENSMRENSVSVESPILEQLHKDLENMRSELKEIKAHQVINVTAI